MNDQQENISNETVDDDVRARRESLKKCGKFAVGVPPVMALLLTRDASAGGTVFSGTEGLEVDK